MGVCSSADQNCDELVHSQLDALVATIQRRDHKACARHAAKLARFIRGRASAGAIPATFRDIIVGISKDGLSFLQERGADSVDSLVGFHKVDWSELEHAGFPEADARKLRERVARVHAARSLSVLLVQAAKLDNASAVHILVGAGATVGACSEGGKTALMWAAMKGCAGACRALMACGADVSQTDDGGRTAVTMAKALGHSRILELLQGQFRAGSDRKGGAGVAGSRGGGLRGALRRTGIGVGDIDTMFEEGYDEVDWFHTANEKDWDRMRRATGLTQAQTNRIKAAFH